MSPHVKTLANWLAAALGIGTFAGMVNVVVGLLSGAWIALQIYSFVRYDLPVKRAASRVKLAKLRAGMQMDTDQAPLS